MTIPLQMIFFSWYEGRISLFLYLCVFFPLRTDFHGIHGPRSFQLVPFFQFVGTFWNSDLALRTTWGSFMHSVSVPSYLWSNETSFISAYFGCQLLMPDTELDVGNTEINDVNSLLSGLGHSWAGEMQTHKNVQWNMIVEMCTTCLIKSGEFVSLLKSFNWVRLWLSVSDEKHINGIYLLWGSKWKSWMK